MKKSLILFLSLLAFIPASFVTRGVDTSTLSEVKIRRQAALPGSQTLRVLNWEDYIYVQDEENGYTEKDLTDQFIDWMHENHPEYADVSITYSTTDTNETMLNELTTGKAHYDLICPSDYGIQKLMASDSLVNLTDLKEKHNLTDELTNYETFASPRLLSYLETIQAESNANPGLIYNLTDYAMGYMWGTLGLIFNPEYDIFKARNMSAERVISEMRDWSVLWNSDYHGTISAKDSMRDTYFIGEAETYKDELLALLEEYELSEQNEEDLNTYSQGISEILNRCDDKSIQEVKATLLELKKNIFGLEVDSGKQDIVTGYVGVNTAWSGDAVFSMDTADEYNKKTNKEVEYGLCYSIPYTGANIWFDGWCMPKDDTRSEAQEAIALYFIDFLSNPDNALQNVDYIGYTSFIGGDCILDLMKDWYDIRTDYIYFVTEDEEYLSLYYIDPETEEETEVWYDAFHYEEEADPLYDDVELYYYLDEESEEIVTLDEKYNELFIIDEEWQEVDLSYFFNGTLDEYEDDIDTIFYTDEYYVSYIDDNGEEVLSDSVGRQFFCQFPDEKTINRCVIMADYGKQNDAIRIMWEDFKSNEITIQMVIITSVLVGSIIIIFTAMAVTKSLTRKLRKARRNQKN